MINKRYTISEAMYQLLHCPWRVKLMEESVRHIGKPHASEDFYRFVSENIFPKSVDTEKSFALR